MGNASLTYKMKIYLAGPINGCSDDEANGWRSMFKSAWPNVLDPMVRDYRGVEDVSYREIVEQDKADITASDAVLVYFERPSVGTSMEVLYAWSKCKKIVLVDKSSKPLSPWLRYHSDKIFKTLSEAIEYFRGNIE